MARPLRIEYPGAYYHVMNRGLAHSDVFLNAQDRERFLELIGETCQLWQAGVYAYCLMDNHLRRPSSMRTWTSWTPAI